MCDSVFILTSEKIRSKVERGRQEREMKLSSGPQIQDLGEERINRENIHLLFLLLCPIEFHFFFFLGSVYKEYYLRDTDLLSTPSA